MTDTPGHGAGAAPPAQAADDPAGAAELPEQMRVRRRKRAALLERGDDPYPVGVPRTHLLRQLVEEYGELPPDSATSDRVAVAGRVIFLRDTGRLCFARLREGGGAELQAMLAESDLGAEGIADWKALVDIGDHVAVEGEVVTSRRGELSVRVEGWRLAAKALRPLPVAHRPLSDEARVRQRYVDLIVNPRARQTVLDRAAVLRSLRDTLDRYGYVEVETPVLQMVHGGASARPFHTHLNAFDQPMSLRIALELYLERCTVGGVDRVYEIGRTFRNEGVDWTHQPEFTMLEAYQAYGDYDTMADLTRRLVLDAARALGSTVVPGHAGAAIELDLPWRELTIHEAVSTAVGSEVAVDTPVSRLRGVADEREVDVPDDWDAGQIVLELFEKLVERTLVTPTFVKDYPASVRPLARPHRTIPGLVEAWDLVIGGVELAVAYSQLVDPVEMRRRLTAQSRLAAGGDPEAMRLDEDFLRALEYGMPPTGGMGLGVDRLLMLLTGERMRDVVLFPLLRPE